MPSIRTILLLSLSLAALFALPALASAASYYVSPSGGGSTCSSASPCSLNEGLSKAGVGDEVVLKDGTYGQLVRVSRDGISGSPITIRAENRRQAIIKAPNSTSDGAVIFNLQNRSWITVRGLIIDGSNRGMWGVRIQSSGSQRLNGIIIEDSEIRNIGGPGIIIQSAKNIIIRHNLIDGVGKISGMIGEGIYHGTNSGPNAFYANFDVQIYGNTLRGITHNFIDIKPGAVESKIHHNIMEGAQKAVDGCITGAGTRSEAYDNIIRNTSCGSAAVDYLGESNGMNIHDNVFQNINANKALGFKNPPSLSPVNIFRACRTMEINVKT